MSPRGRSYAVAWLLLNIVCWSGGKDSTATIILAYLLGIHIDYIIFAEVMFSKTVSGENPKHIDFIMNKAKPLFESWGYKVVIVRSEKTYLDHFYHIIENPKKHLEHKGMQYGFALNGFCSIKRDLKLKPINDFLKALKEPCNIYEGICADELKRLESLHKTNNISLLEQLGYTEQMAYSLCQKYDLLSPTYGLTKRGGCWMCPWAKEAEFRAISQLYPEAWKKFVSLEDEPNVANSKWNVYSKRTLKEIDEDIRKYKQIDMFDYYGKETIL